MQTNYYPHYRAPTHLGDLGGQARGLGRHPWRETTENVREAPELQPFTPSCARAQTQVVVGGQTRPWKAFKGLNKESTVADHPVWCGQDARPRLPHHRDIAEVVRASGGARPRAAAQRAATARSAAAREARHGYARLKTQASDLRSREVKSNAIPPRCQVVAAASHARHRAFHTESHILPPPPGGRCGLHWCPASTWQCQQTFALPQAQQFNAVAGAATDKYFQIAASGRGARDRLSWQSSHQLDMRDGTRIDQRRRKFRRAGGRTAHHCGVHGTSSNVASTAPFRRISLPRLTSTAPTSRIQVSI